MNPIHIIKQRPITPLKKFDQAFEMAKLSKNEKELIDYIRYIGTFTQVSLTQILRLKPKPPVLSTLCEVCRKIGTHMPQHFEAVREWSKEISEDGVRWDGDLICSTAWNIDGERLTPESGTTQYHTFVVHKELFQGLNGS